MYVVVTDAGDSSLKKWGVVPLSVFVAQVKRTLTDGRRMPVAMRRTVPVRITPVVVRHVSDLIGRLTDYKEANGLSYRALAPAIGVSHAYILQVKAGRRTLSYEVGRRIERYLQRKG